MKRLTSALAAASSENACTRTMGGQRGLDGGVWRRMRGLLRGTAHGERAGEQGRGQSRKAVLPRARQPPLASALAGARGWDRACA